MMNTATRAGNLARIYLAAACMLALAAVPRAAAADEDISGDWEVKMDRNGRETFATLSISKDADGKLSARWGGMELSDVKFDGKKLTFVRTLRFGDREFSLNYEGTLKDGKFTGTLSSERGEFAANASRKKPKCPALGKWNIHYTIRDRDIEATLTVSEGADGAFAADWTSGRGEHTISNVKFQDGKLSFARKSKFGEREFESTYEGTVKGNELVGAFEGGFGKTAANGTRVGGELIGQWELTSTTDRGPRTSRLTVFGDLTGRYELFGGEIPIKDLKLDGDQVTFSVEMGFGDQPFTIEFKGKLDGTTLDGEIVTPRGSREVKGKKAVTSL